MDNFRTILGDLYQVLPTEPILCPVPFTRKMTFEEKFLNTLRALRRAKGLRNRILQLANAYYLGQLLEKGTESLTQRSYYAQKLSLHYRTAVVRTYYIFEPFGVTQIMRTENTSLTMIRQLGSQEFHDLVTESYNILNGVENLEESVVT